MKFTLKLSDIWMSTFSIVLLLGACTEELVPTPNEYSKLLTGDISKTWKLISVVVKTEERSDIVRFEESYLQIPSFIEDGLSCRYDDQYVFYAGSEQKYELIDGPTKCDEEDPEVLVEHVWSMVSAKASMDLYVPVISRLYILPFIVDQLTEDCLVLEIYLSNEKSKFRLIFKNIKEE